MEIDFIEKLTATTRFGKISVDMEFVTAEQLKEAMVEHVEEDLADKPHRPTGKILLENGWITKEQFGIVLKEKGGIDYENKEF